MFIPVNPSMFSLDFFMYLSILGTYLQLHESIPRDLRDQNLGR